MATIPVRPVMLQASQKVKIVRLSYVHDFEIDIREVVSTTSNLLANNVIICGPEVATEMKDFMAGKLTTLYTKLFQRQDLVRRKRTPALIPALGNILSVLTGVATLEDQKKQEDKISSAAEEVALNRKKIMHTDILLSEVKNLTDMMYNEHLDSVLSVEKVMVDIERYNVCHAIEGNLKVATMKVITFLDMLIEAKDITPYGSTAILEGKIMDQVLKDVMYEKLRD